MEQPDQQVFPIALGLLRERDERSIRIEIETDSTILMNEDEDVQQRNQLATSVMQGFSQITSAAQGNQAIISVGLQLLMYVVRGLPNGKIIEESLQQTATQMMQPPPPPPPDPNIALQQQQLQLQQQEMQAKAQKDQADTEVQQASLQLDGQKAAMDAKLKEAELQLDAQKHSETLASKQGELAMKSKLDQLELLHKTSTDAYDQKLDSMRVRIESVLAEAKVKEEAFYARLDQAKAIHDMVLAKHEALEAKAVPTKKLAQFHRDPAGNTTHIAVSEVPVDGVDTPQAQNLGNDIDNNLMGK